MTVRSAIKSALKKRREDKIRVRQRRAEREFHRRVKKYVIHAAAIDELLSPELSKNIRAL